MADAAMMAQMLAGMSKAEVLGLLQQMAAIAGAQPPLSQQPAAPIATHQPVVAPAGTGTARSAAREGGSDQSPALRQRGGRVHFRLAG